MAFASRFTHDLHALANAYGAHFGRGIDAVSGYVFGNGGFFRRLANGADCRTATLEAAQGWFDRNWPADLPWPQEIPRAFDPARAGFLNPVVEGVDLSAADVAFLARLAHEMAWPNGRRPAWWHDMGMRDFIVRSHRQMSVLLCAKKGAERFGSRFPKKSAVHEFWQRLDQLKQPSGVA